MKLLKSLAEKCNFKLKIPQNISKRFSSKVLNNITCANILLKKLGKVDAEACSFGCYSREELEHLFYLCPFSQAFWLDSELFWYENITLSLKEIIIGFCGKDLDFLNYCILVGKSESISVGETR